MSDIVFLTHWPAKGGNAPLVLTQHNLLAWCSHIQLWWPASHQHMAPYSVLLYQPPLSASSFGLLLAITNA